MLHIVITVDDNETGSTVASEISSLLESLKVGVQLSKSCYARYGHKSPSQEEHERGLLELRGKDASIKVITTRPAKTSKKRA